MHSADPSFIAETTAKMLLEVKAVLFSQDKPLIFTSGWASPVYIDCRKLIFYPRSRDQLVEFATATLARDAGFEQFDVVAGGETAGIPYAAWIADRLGLPEAEMPAEIPPEEALGILQTIPGFSPGIEPSYPNEALGFLDDSGYGMW